MLASFNLLYFETTTDRSTNRPTNDQQTGWSVELLYSSDRDITHWEFIAYNCAYSFLLNWLFYSILVSSNLNYTILRRLRIIYLCKYVNEMYIGYIQKWVLPQLLLIFSIAPGEWKFLFCPGGKLVLQSISSEEKTTGWARARPNTVTKKSLLHFNLNLLHTLKFCLVSGSKIRR